MGAAYGDTEFYDDEDEIVLMSKDVDLDPNLPNGDMVFDGTAEDYTSSDFYVIFKKSYDEGMQIVEESATDPSQDPNPYLMATFLMYLLKTKLPYYPLWSRFMQVLVLPHLKNPLTSAAIDLRFMLSKTDRWIRRRAQRASRFVREHLEDTERKIRLYHVNSNFRKYKRSAEKPLEDRTEEGRMHEEPTCDDPGAISDDTDDVHREDHCKRSKIEKLPGIPCEIWRRKSIKTVRLPEGYYSARQTELYASNLSKKIAQNVYPKVVDACPAKKILIPGAVTDTKRKLWIHNLSQVHIPSSTCWF